MFEWFRKNFLCKKYFLESSTDPLTGLRNRRNYELEIHLMKKASRMIKKDACNWYALIDLNNFKKINDKYGHSEGDRVLKEISIIFLNVFRNGDLIFRIGGDEFVIIITRINKESLLKIFDRLFKKINNKLTKYTENGFGISVGAMKFERDTVGDSLLDMADKAMYLAKKQKKQKGGGIIFFDELKDNKF